MSELVVSLSSCFAFSFSVTVAIVSSLFSRRTSCVVVLSSLKISFFACIMLEGVPSSRLCSAFCVWVIIELIVFNILKAVLCVPMVLVVVAFIVELVDRISILVKIVSVVSLTCSPKIILSSPLFLLLSSYLSISSNVSFVSSMSFISCFSATLFLLVDSVLLISFSSVIFSFVSLSDSLVPIIASTLFGFPSISIIVTKFPVSFTTFCVTSLSICATIPPLGPDLVKSNSFVSSFCFIPSLK
uniref:Uncharacterized protein n=1 Tax=Cacopsylla melanoneura TaxID=428564 RepID=A0A8D8ZMF0_9HEMI